MLYNNMFLNDVVTVSNIDLIERLRFSRLLVLADAEEKNQQSKNMLPALEFSLSEYRKTI
jgi:hypothetical protein